MSIYVYYKLSIPGQRVILTRCGAQAALAIRDDPGTFHDLERHIGVGFRVGKVGGREYESL